MTKIDAYEAILKKSEKILAKIKPIIASAKQEEQSLRQRIADNTQQLQQLYNTLLLKVACKKMEEASPEKNASTLARGIAALRKKWQKQPKRVRGRKRRKHAISI